MIFTNERGRPALLAASLPASVAGALPGTLSCHPGRGGVVKRTSRIFVAGGNTLAGAALLERLRAGGYHNLVGVPPDEPDLTIAGQVEDFFSEARPEYVFLVGGKSGGIEQNRRYPADLMLDNLLVTAH